MRPANSGKQRCVPQLFPIWKSVPKIDFTRKFWGKNHFRLAKVAFARISIRSRQANLHPFTSHFLSMILENYRKPRLKKPRKLPEETIEAWTFRHSDLGGDVPYRDVARLEKVVRNIIAASKPESGFFVHSVRNLKPLFDAIEQAEKELNR